MNTGKEAVRSQNQLLTTVAWKIGNEINYALEGSVFIGGAAIQWLRDGLGLVKSAADTQAMAERVGANNPVYLVPAFTGLGAPYWDAHARGAMFGLTRDTGIAEIAKGVTGKRLFRHWPLKKFDVDSIVLGSIARADWSGFVQGSRRPGAVDHLLDVVNGRFSHA